MAGNDLPNPYESPAATEVAATSWIGAIRNFIASFEPKTVEQRLLRGYGVVHYGVVFRLSRWNTSLIIAALPIGVNDDEHAQRNVVEAQRVLRKLLDLHPALHVPLHGRRLVVLLVDKYGNDATELRRQIVLPKDWANWDVDDDDLDEELIPGG
ncbi:hypothetical protein NA78x_001614 [Anatilimnocola sp. NA78]|uniref:hypothetical protein n=1 Tax=Anatilimnocola sp. NA78 TaxID=3415683 RepID=UPI003CE5A765